MGDFTLFLFSCLLMKSLAKFLIKSKNNFACKVHIQVLNIIKNIYRLLYFFNTFINLLLFFIFFSLTFVLDKAVEKMRAKCLAQPDVYKCFLLAWTEKKKYAQNRECCRKNIFYAIEKIIFQSWIPKQQQLPKCLIN